MAFRRFKTKPCLGKWLYDFRDVIKTTTHLDNLFTAVVVVIVTQSWCKRVYKGWAPTSNVVFLSRFIWNDHVWVFGLFLSLMWDRCLSPSRVDVSSLASESVHSQRIQCFYSMFKLLCRQCRRIYFLISDVFRVFRWYVDIVYGRTNGRVFFRISQSIRSATKNNF